MFRGARRALHFAGVNLIAFLRSIAGYFASWPMQELTGTTALADNVALALGRELSPSPTGFTFTGDDPDGWTVVGEIGADPEVSEVGSGQAHGGAGTGACNLYASTLANTPRITIAGNLSVGREYRVAITVSNDSGAGANSLRTDSFVTESVYPLGTNSFDMVADSTTFSLRVIGTAPSDITIDAVSIKQINILDSSAGLGLLDGTYTGVSLAQTGAGNIPYVVAFDGIAANVTVKSTEYNSGYDPTVDFCKAIIIGKTTWDAAARYIFDDYVDADNWVRCYGTAVLDQLAFEIRAGGTTEQILWDSNGVTDLMLLDVGRESNVFKARVNGVSVGSEAIAGTLVGNFVSNNIGQRQDGTLFHLGSAAYCENFTEYVSDADMLRITAAFGV